MAGATPQHPSLMSTLLEQGKRILRAEAALARQDVKEDARGAARGSLLLGASAWMGFTGTSALVLAAALALPERPVRGVLVTGLVLLGGSLATALIGLRTLPREPLARARQGLQEASSVVREQLSH